MSTIRLKLKLRNGICKAKVLIKHEMTTYRKAGQLNTKVNYITSVTAKAGGKKVYELQNSQFLSKNPLFKFQFYAKSGEIFELTWIDLLGNSDTKYMIIR